MVSFSLKLPTMAKFSQNSPTISMSLLLFFFFHHLFTTRISSYRPVEHLAVNCGNYGDVTANDHKNWIGDIGSSLFSLIDPANGTQHIKAEASSMQPIPYGTARLSRSEFSYSFPVIDGQKFVRLFFYLSSYGDFPRCDSLFTVKAGNYTLLKDFNASLNAGGASDGIILREYCVNVDSGQRLNINFTPSLSHPNAYAFINGIEVVSMPTFLYYTNPNDQNAMMLDGGTQKFLVNNDRALETIYRINVGGRQIPPENDTGMFRNWVPDNPYLEVEHPQSISAGLNGLKPIYKDDQSYFAPDEVYMTARNYGKKEKSKFNVTWEFEVDSRFYYMVRLHFCEFDEGIKYVGDRVFQIFIADILVEEKADVMRWSHKQILVPVHRDYAISMQSEGSLKKVNLSIKLQPYTTSAFNDVLLNGIEIFKISDSNDDLGGPNPDPPPFPLMPPTLRSSKNGKKLRVISIVVGAISGFVVLFLIVLLVFRRMIRARVYVGSSWWGQKLAEDSSKKNKSNGSLLPTDLCRRFSIAEIRAATNNFEDIFIVGVGGFGNVYKGYIDGLTLPVAIKRLKQGSKQGRHEFQTEIEMLSQLRHNHLVSLIGYCNDCEEMILVYEYMPRGNLREHLYDSHNPPLSWKQRLEMCLGAARGLHYLHTEANQNIIHRDVKTNNILIDEKWVAKVSDFGLSRIGPTGTSKSHISTVVKGSVGYLDPEYYKRQRLTQKSDVYSFGVVLLEVLCGRPPLIRNVEKHKASLVDWVRKCHCEGVIHEAVDPFMVESIKLESLKPFCDMALKCLEDDGNERPSMNDIVWGLEFVLQLQEGTEKVVGLDAPESEGKSEEGALLGKPTKVEESSKAGFTGSDESKGSKLTSSTSENPSVISGLVFSELDHPTVR